ATPGDGPPPGEPEVVVVEPDDGAFLEDEAAEDLVDDHPIVVEELEPVEAALEGRDVTAELPTFEEIPPPDPPRDSTVLPPAPDDPFTVLVCMLADVAIAAGSPHVAALLPG